MIQKTAHSVGRGSAMRWPITSSILLRRQRLDPTRLMMTGF